ncbi:MarR family transcriptional regulator [Sphingomonas carotinifaciens]|uniref:DNA-binding transcriptional regulator, MarR family n=1 Tax=Sphingomonas carotinifaciens TaxID=1166323 RepID=A0A1G7PYN5_9SPHN|nr:MarR family transcriptional regulator [Sphingomonas carotinifaciens]MBB4087562.1 DNA-binding MarR family transcriptional regulator [Sphingomonas carotinifaciens]MWC45645.1 MarR family transcriptional regulator [Sphingomonas carotinifaciens]SDF91318.1 DNA-binding transcriptional regulator, MarR family [Sphingomonas carotinifaciens]
MDPAPSDDDLIDVVVRLPRKAVENTLLSAAAATGTLADQRLAEAKTLLAGRRRRGSCFKGVRFSDPSWDMILELYVAEQEGSTIAVSQLCTLSGGSMTTALRHIEDLEALGLINRAPDPTDRRKAIVTMLPRLRSAIEQWLDLQIAALPPHR